MIRFRYLLSVLFLIKILCIEGEMLNSNGTFLYFAYGSNLLSKRIHINCPSAVRIGIGRLNDYQLDFYNYSERWHGAVSTVAKRPGRHVWGAIWQINLKEQPALDHQEEVDQNVYFRHEVELLQPNKTTITCWTYELVYLPSLTDDIEKLEWSRRPSPVYRQTMILGAYESNLPIEYQMYLYKIPDNGYNGTLSINNELN